MDVNSFMNFRPNRDQWNEALDSGWGGPDGSSCSTDTIFGIEIGRTSTDFECRNLPANLHDWRYHLGRKHNLGKRHRHAADVEYREGCIEVARDVMTGRVFIALTVLRAYVRYIALRLFGKGAFTAD